MGEMDVTTRATVPLEHAYPSTGLGTYAVMVGCLTTADFVVDTGHLYALEVGSINGGKRPVILSSPSARKLSWSR
jgi:hypothetical protein